MKNSFKMSCSQVSGKQPKLLSQDEKLLMKGYIQDQQKFYQHIQTIPINNPLHSFKFFLPKFSGIRLLSQIPQISQNQTVTDQKTLQWLQHLKYRYIIRNKQNKFIILQNITYKFQLPNVLDIKIGTRQFLKKHKITKQYGLYSFILNGCRVNFRNQKNNQTIFLSKYFFKSIKTQQQILLHFALYFYDGNKIRIQLLKNIIDELRKLIINFTLLTGYKFYSTSLCIFYDSINDQKYKLKLLDFGRNQMHSNHQPDQQSLKGLHNIHKFLMSVLQKKQQFQTQLYQIKQKYLNQNILIIPQNKIIQYTFSSKQSLEGGNSPKKTLNFNDKFESDSYLQQSMKEQKQLNDKIELEQHKNKKQSNLNNNKIELNPLYQNI